MKDRDKLLIVFLASIAAGLVFGLIAAAHAMGGPPPWFAPGPDPERGIVEYFGKAEESIKYQMYNFTSEPIATALIEAKGRGVDVVIIIDHVAASQPACQAARCVAAGCKVYVDWSHPIAHNKVRIIDGKCMLSGSYNDSAQAKANAENVTEHLDPDEIEKFEEHFAACLAHSLTWEQSLAESKRRAAAKAAKAEKSKSRTATRRRARR